VEDVGTNAVDGSPGSFGSGFPRVLTILLS
jgi:hypothetical protein